MIPFKFEFSKSNFLSEAGLGHVRCVWFGFLTWVLGIKENMLISIFSANFDKNSSYITFTAESREKVIFDRN